MNDFETLYPVNKKKRKLFWLRVNGGWDWKRLLHSTKKILEDKERMDGNNVSFSDPKYILRYI